MKMLLYCTKAKPYLVERLPFNEKKFYQCRKKNDYYSLNGKILAECDFEVEEIRYVEYADEWGYETNTLNEDDLIDKSCLSGKQLFNYLKHCKNGAYAIHIKNLNIFYTPRELSDYYSIIDMGGGMLGTKPLTKAPQNMMHISINHWEYCFYNPDDINILISIKPEWLCKILNGEKTIEVRKKVLRRMI